MVLFHHNCFTILSRINRTSEAKRIGGRAYARSACWEIILRAYIFQLRARGWRKKQIYLCFWFKLVNFFLTDLKDMCGWGWDKWVLAVDKRYGVFQTRLFHWVSPVPRLLHWVILVNAPLNPSPPQASSHCSLTVSPNLSWNVFGICVHCSTY